MKPLPTPCPAHLIPDATGLEAFNAAYRAAKAADAVYVGTERQDRRWTVKADTLTAAPGHIVEDAVIAAIRAATAKLLSSGQIGPSAGTGPVHYTLPGVLEEQRARELAAALHAALYGECEPLDRAVLPLH